MLEFLKDPQNREVLAWIGGGLCVVISGVWAAYLKLREKPKAPAAPKPAPSVSADRGGIAAGGNVTVVSNRIPLGVWLLAAAGIALIALALLSSGDTTVLDTSADVDGDMTDSSIEINRTGQ